MTRTKVLFAIGTVTTGFMCAVMARTFNLPSPGIVGSIGMFAYMAYAFDWFPWPLLAVALFAGPALAFVYGEIRGWDGQGIAVFFAVWTLAASVGFYMRRRMPKREPTSV